MRLILVITVISSAYLGYVSGFVTPLNHTHHLVRTNDENNHEVPESVILINSTEKSEEHKEEGFRGMRCDLALYTSGNLNQAATQACELMKKKKKTWGFIRYPLPYQPSLEEIKNPLKSNDDDKPQGPFFLYPILSSGKVYKFGRTGPHRVIVNSECQVAGAVIKLNSRTKCQGRRCWNPFRYQHLIYKTCELDYYK